MRREASPRWPALHLVHSIVFDFDGVFTDNKVHVDQDGRESVTCNRGDGLGIDFLRAAQSKGWLKAEVFILSKETNPVVRARASKLRLKCESSVADKLTFLEGHLAARGGMQGGPFDGLIYLGNDLNDLPVMRRAGFSVAPADAHVRIKEVASVVLSRNGGEGFVREFVEQLLGVETMTVEEIDVLVRDC